ncbi:MAG: hypothetical protein COX57_02335 [Alphaproteobacteria bacterium CG_4_10_14_0_2_um_filter_63_37]|nr:MAG: hypothetical protein AUJ55_00275 [Proteobacteria bacterium CG1_02_64_396]PJA25635.1 MAG: hypothetical protein COX57_02335 [Alphaproteobacteria bacterium CG_4_10_14_0_2_um_filter_63_37]
MPDLECPFEFPTPEGRSLRGLLIPPPTSNAPLLVFLSGFRSVHSGYKASAIAAWAAQNGCGCLRFDHLGHGISDGPFEAFRIGRGIEEAAAAIASVLQPGQALVLVGSSMGGWMGLEIARRRLLPVAGLLLIAPATEFIARRLGGALRARNRLSQDAGPCRHARPL